MPRLIQDEENTLYDVLRSDEPILRKKELMV